MTVWVNQAGNGFADPVTIRGTPRAAGASHAARRHGRHRHRRGAVDLRPGLGPRLQLQVPGPDRRHQTLPAQPDRQPRRRDHHHHLRALHRLRHRRPGRRAPVADHPALPRPGRRQHHRDRLLLPDTPSPANTSTTTATGTAPTGNSAASPGSTSATPSPPPARQRRYYSPPTETRTWFHLGPVGPESGAWTEGLDLSGEYWHRTTHRSPGMWTPPPSPRA